MKRAILWVIFSLTATAFAQMPSLEPPAEVTAMKWMVGEWTSKVHWTMEGQEMDADMTLKNEFEGQFLKQTSTMDMMGMKFTEVGYLGYDKAKKKYYMYTFTNYGPTPRIEWGTLENNKMVMISEPWDAGMGAPMTSRATLTKKSDTEVHFVLEFKNGDKWDKAAEGTFKKK